MSINTPVSLCIIVCKTIHSPCQLVRWKISQNIVCQPSCKSGGGDFSITGIPPTTSNSQAKAKPTVPDLVISEIQSLTHFNFTFCTFLRKKKKQNKKDITRQSTIVTDIEMYHSTSHKHHSHHTKHLLCLCPFVIHC